MISLSLYNFQFLFLSHFSKAAFNSKLLFGSSKSNLFRVLSIVRVFQVEKLKDLCLKQREEIKSLKSAILFPDVMNSHLQDLLDKQGSELKQAKQLIPTLQKQVTSLTGQLQCLAEDLAEVLLQSLLYSIQFCYSSILRLHLD